MTYDREGGFLPHSDYEITPDGNLVADGDSAKSNEEGLRGVIQEESTKAEFETEPKTITIEQEDKKAA